MGRLGGILGVREPLNAGDGGSESEAIKVLLEVAGDGQDEDELEGDGERVLLEVAPLGKTKELEVCEHEGHCEIITDSWASGDGGG